MDLHESVCKFHGFINSLFHSGEAIESEIIRLFGGEVTKGDLLRLGILISY